MDTNNVRVIEATMETKYLTVGEWNDLQKNGQVEEDEFVKRGYKIYFVSAKNNIELTESTIVQYDDKSMDAAYNQGYDDGYNDGLRDGDNDMSDWARREYNNMRR